MAKILPGNWSWEVVQILQENILLLTWGTITTSIPSLLTISLQSRVVFYHQIKRERLAWIRLNHQGFHCNWPANKRQLGRVVFEKLSRACQDFQPLYELGTQVWHVRTHEKVIANKLKKKKIKDRFNESQNVKMRFFFQGLSRDYQCWEE